MLSLRGMAAPVLPRGRQGFAAPRFPFGKWQAGREMGE